MRPPSRTFFDLTQVREPTGESIAMNMPVVMCPFKPRTPQIYTAWHRDTLFGIMFMTNQYYKTSNQNNLTMDFFK